MSNYYLTYKVKHKFAGYNIYASIARKFLNYALDIKFAHEVEKLKGYYVEQDIRINPRAVSLLVQRYNNTQIRKILKQYISDEHLSNGRNFLKTLCFKTFKSKFLEAYEVDEELILPIFRCRSKQQLSDIIENSAVIYKFKEQFFKDYYKRRLVRSSAEVGKFWKHTDMPSRMVSDILRKYMVKTVKQINHIKLKVNKNVNEINHDGKYLTIKCKGINIHAKWHCPRHYVSIDSVEIDKNYLYVTCSHKQKTFIQIK